MTGEKTGGKCTLNGTFALRAEFLLLAVLLVAGASVLPAGNRGDTRVWSFTPTQEQMEALDRISADSLKGHLSFLASDLLQGRPTPSAGQDIAAEYIAAQFRRAGLEPAGNDGYFQTVAAQVAYPNPAGFRLRLTIGDKSFDVPYTHFSMSRVGMLQMDQVPLVPISFGPGKLPANLAGSVAVAQLPASSQESASFREFRLQRRDLIRRLADAKAAALVLYAGENPEDTQYFSASDLVRPHSGGTRNDDFTVMTISDGDITQALKSIRGSGMTATLSIYLSKPVEKSVTLRNVCGLLRGTDPALRGSYVLVTAHYDGTGAPLDAPSEAIWNAANDNGSGTVSVLEIASAIASLKTRPRRSIAFITFFGEEKGLLGSKYYAEHPLFPIESTVGSVNLEQVGRTDSSIGDQTNHATLTGFDYSDLWGAFRDAGERLGIMVSKEESDSDDYFLRSDNRALADLGIPAHTLCVSLDFSDYHTPGDKWEKVNYANLERTDKMAALAILNIAQNEFPPRWNANNKHALTYLRAWKQRHEISNAR